MIHAAERTIELMNEYWQSVPLSSWRSLQHFLVGKIVRLETKVAALKQELEEKDE